MSIKFKFLEILTRITDSLHDDLCTSVTTSRRILLGIRTVSDRSCRGNQSARSIFSNFLLNPLAYTDVPETAGLARSINP